MTSITYLSPGTTDLRQIVFAVDQALERLQDLTTTPSANSVIGTTTNDNATAGNIGEFISATVASSSAVPLSAAALQAITSIPLTPGDWDVDGTISFTGGSSTAVTDFLAAVSSSTGFPSNYIVNPAYGLKPFSFVNPIIMRVQPSRQSLAATSSISLLAFSSFGVDTCSAYGTIMARRAR